VALTDPADFDPKTATVVRVETYRITREIARETALVDAAVIRLRERIKRWCKRNGYWLIGYRQEAVPEPDLATAVVLLTVEGYCRELTDGEWPSIHAAIRQDQADRDALRASQGPGGPRRPDTTGDPF
jgi:hypothetical protein